MKKNDYTENKFTENLQCKLLKVNFNFFDIQIKKNGLDKIINMIFKNCFLKLEKIINISSNPDVKIVNNLFWNSELNLNM